ncbi:hypothetical protein JKF63_01825 [Porcisia hertigi]|uniref:C2 domain-containing protein n=1 Tax=Porcisia hertigi TaxID=2761500 RepID=A0A836H5F8_9TRYP|nr:hypothetical protein JKF63_01825 [Porcisia hertigi]
MSCIAPSDTVKLLTEQISEKDFRISELENRLKDLLHEAKELDEKLSVANRNARVLEEENSNYHLRHKGLESKDSHIIPLQKEAKKLIQENEELRQSLAESKELVKQLSTRNQVSERDAERRISELQSQCERMHKERLREHQKLESTRHQCVDLQKHLDDDDETLKSAKELWGQERERYQQKIDELLDFIRRAEKPVVLRATRHRDDGVEEPLEQLLLKEEVCELERKLKEAQQKSWEKEKMWVLAENELRHRLSELQMSRGSESRNDKALFQAMKDQVRALQDEIQTLRSDKRSSRWGQDAAVNSTSATSTAMPPAKSTVPEEWAARYDFVLKENDDFRDQADAAKAKVFELQNIIDEKMIACKEMEVQLAATQKLLGAASRTPLVDRPSSTRSLSEVSNASRAGRAFHGQDNAHTMVLKQRVRDLEAELRTSSNLKEQEAAINRARIKEYEKQIAELLRENADLRDAGKAQDDVTGGGTVMTSLDGVMRLTRDKRESVEEVMRLLEFAWDSDEEAKRQLRRAKYQGVALAGQDAAKGDEIQRLQKSGGDLENKLRAMEMRVLDNDELKGAVNDLRRQNRGLAGENDQLRARIEDLERERCEGLRRQNAKQNDAKRRIEQLKAEIDELMRKPTNTHRTGSRPVSPCLTARSPQPRIRSPQPRIRSPQLSARFRTPEENSLSQLSVRTPDEQRRSAVPEGAHLAFTVVELTDVLRNGRRITEPGQVTIKLKSIKEKYKTSVKVLSSVIRFDETFMFYLAQPDQDVITLHVFYKPLEGSREFHIGDASFSMATLHRGVPRERIAPVVQSPGTKEARRAAQVQVLLQTDDFGRMIEPTEEEVKAEKMRFNELVSNFESRAVDKLHAVDVYLASAELH